MNRRVVVYRLIPAAALLVAIGYLLLHRNLISPCLLELEVGRFGPMGPILFVLIYALGTALFLPGSILTILGGGLFGPVWGTLCNLIGATMGATLAFMIARYFAFAWVAARVGNRLGRLVRGVDAEGWRFVAFVRLVPLFPFNLVNYAFGLTRIRLAEYVVASFICMAPGAFAYTYVGYAGRQAASGQAGALRAALFALALFAAVAFMPRFIRRLKGASIIQPEVLKERLQNGRDGSVDRRAQCR